MSDGIPMESEDAFLSGEMALCLLVPASITGAVPNVA
jgi:hypothetical protein